MCTGVLEGLRISWGVYIPRSWVPWRQWILLQVLVADGRGPRGQGWNDLPAHAVHDTCVSSQYEIWTNHDLSSSAAFSSESLQFCICSTGCLKEANAKPHKFAKESAQQIGSPAYDILKRHIYRSGSLPRRAASRKVWVSSDVVCIPSHKMVGGVQIWVKCSGNVKTNVEALKIDMTSRQNRNLRFLRPSARLVKSVRPAVANNAPNVGLKDFNRLEFNFQSSCWRLSLIVLSSPVQPLSEKLIDAKTQFCAQLKQLFHFHFHFRIYITYYFTLSHITLITTFYYITLTSLP